ncbi:MAG TPA: aromatic ring-hydroxylating dioxygenase subunit alpha [Polyangiaceae bacterium]
MTVEISRERYTSSDYAAREWRRVWSRVWLLAGRLADLPKPGDRLTYECAGECVVIVRQEDGGVRAFFNSCPHRGRELCESGRAGGDGIRCAYHGWEWELDGSPRRLPLGRGFGGMGERLRLAEARVETFLGFLWVNFDPGARPLSEYLGSLASELAPHRLEEFALVDDFSVELPCNWKVAMDAFSEGYHVPTVHPQLADVIDVERQTITLYEHHHLIVQPFVGLDPGAVAALPAEVSAMLKQMGIELPAAAAGADVRAEIHRAIRAWAGTRGFDLSGLKDEQLTANWTLNVFPNLSMSGVFPHRYFLSRHRPHPHDPRRMFFDFQEYERTPRAGTKVARPAHRAFRYGERPLGETVAQDLENCVRVQRGLESPSLRERPLLLGDFERGVAHMHALLDRYLAAE